MKVLLTATLSAALAATSLTSAVAQNYRDQQSRYEQERRDYERSLREYEAARQRYEQERAAYDRRYGPGAYDRYGAPPPPPYSERPYGGYDLNDRYRPYRDQPEYRYPPEYGREPYYDRYDPAFDPYRPYYDSPCEQSGNRDRTTGTVIGAIVGGALGAVLAGESSEVEGGVLGAVVGGTIGANITRDPRTAERYAAQCDADGYYFTYDQTFPYRERDDRLRGGRYDERYYLQMGCRLAIAPAPMVGRQAAYRYVRVCPDRLERYRITA